MISVALAFIVVACSILAGSSEHCRVYAGVERAYRDAGVEFPFGLMASAQIEMFFHRDRFLSSESNPELRSKREELLRSYKVANLLPLKRGLIVLLVGVPIEALGWFAFAQLS
ncbi:hypothetical protein [Actomonas aquatica]|uniref:Uncharacterized protein n=1 Tax=Actomonas aquatica TaxID=2866162 RepID=A0ABZ1C1P1_9BACT|nr:hypothetical protein [Opitutus sp. WL0086]WRQ85543.1 hypothetical protein K1X11_012090 [Opitutus sp. WL0086]